MEIDGNSLMSVQGQFALGMQKKSLDVTADLANKLMQGSLEAQDQMRASAGVGTNLNIIV